MKLMSTLIATMILALSVASAQSRSSVLFIGNSFTYGQGSPVRFYRAHTVADLNGEGIGGVPALFKSFTAQAGLDYDVSLETRGGSGFEFHLENKLGVIGRRPWDKVVMQGQSMLDLEKPGDATKIIATSKQLADFLRSRNPKVELYLTRPGRAPIRPICRKAPGSANRLKPWRATCAPATTRRPPAPASRR